MRLTSIFLFLFFASTGAWAAFPNYTVCSSSCDFTTLQGAVADLAANHAVLGQPVTITISGTWSSNDTTPVNITGLTTTATNTLTITTTGAARHNGTWTSNAYILYGGAGSGSADGGLLQVGNQYVIIDGLQIEATYVTHHTIGIFLLSGYTTIKNCIIRGITVNGTPDHGIDVFYNSGPRYIYNNVIYGFTRGTYCGIRGDYSDTVYAYNNTIYGNDYGIGEYGVTWVLKNSLVSGNVTTDYKTSSGSVSALSTNNLSSDATVPTYGTYYSNATVTFVSAGSNFNLASTDTGATGLGVNLSLDSNLSFFQDITGRTSMYAWDIGAFKNTNNQTNTIVSATLNSAIIN